MLLEMIYGKKVFINIKEKQYYDKKICKIKIVQTNNEEVEFKNILLRQLVGIIIVEGSLVTASAIWHQIFTLLTGINVVSILMYAGFVTGIISACLVLFSKDHRALHDYIGNTKVVMCK